MALSLLVSNALKFNKAGSFKLEKLKEDGTPSTDVKDIYTSGQNLIGVINAAWSSTTEELRDENNKNPRAVYNTQTQETVGIEMRTEDPYLDLYLKGGKVTTKTTGVQEYIDLPITIPDNGEYVVKDEDGNDALIDDKTAILVRDVTTNEDYEKVATAPTTGQFSVSLTDGKFTFSVADKGKQVYISAGYEVENVTEFARDKDSSSTSYRLTINGPAQQYDETGKMILTEVFPAVQLASGEMASMARQLSPQSTKTLNFQNVASKGKDGSKRIFSKPPVDVNAE